MQNETWRSLLAYLNSAAPWYPGGVPRAEISKAIAARKATHAAGKNTAVSKFIRAGAPLLFVANDAADPELFALLEGAIVKGMNLPLEKASIVYLCDRDPAQLEIDINSALAESRASFAVLLGARTHCVFNEPSAEVLIPGRWRVKNGVKFMPSHALAAVHSDKQIKREFWQHLKLVMQALQEADQSSV